MKLNTKSNKGFTIIEVLIVLAVAGMVMAIVFLAVPGLQRNQRNTQRRADVSRMLAGVSEGTSNNNGTVPASLPAQATDRLNAYAATDVVYANVTSGSGTVLTTIDTSKVYISNGLKCVSPMPSNTGASSATFAIPAATPMQTVTAASIRTVTAVYAIETTGTNVALQCLEM